MKKTIYSSEGVDHLLMLQDIGGHLLVLVTVLVNFLLVSFHIRLLNLESLIGKLQLQYRSGRLKRLQSKGKTHCNMVDFSCS